MALRIREVLSLGGALVLIASGGAATKAMLLDTEVSSSNADAKSTSAFLNSIGINTHVDQGYDPTSYVAPLVYMGIRQVRDGSRNLASDIMLHKRTGVRFAINAGGDLDGLLAAGRTLAGSDALLALEGPNEPNNFPITYKGEKGGGGRSWTPVLDFQKALYAAVKSDRALSHFPVFGVSEVGAETDDVGLQFLSDSRSPGSQATPLSDYANDHNYVSGNGNLFGDNQAWNAADPTLNSRWDGLYGNHGVTWRSHFKGYSVEQLKDLPRVTTETGWDTSKNAGGEKTQGAVLTNTYLDQFKRGWAYTFVYELRDGEGSTGNQGLYQGQRAKLAATYLHNLTSILSEGSIIHTPGALAFSISNAPPTVHSLLLQKKEGEFDLIVWNERANGQDAINIKLKDAPNKIAIYDIESGTSPIKNLYSTSSVDVTLTDHAVILEIDDKNKAKRVN